MSRGKLLKKPYRSILYWTVCILAVVTLVAFAVSAVYAKYVTSGSLDDSANVASVGIEEFELVDHGAHANKDTGVDTGVAKWENSLEYNCAKVIPGVDISGPHIKLKINSAVNYTLYVKVKVPNVDFIKFGNGNPTTKQTVTYRMSDYWYEDRTHRVTEKDYTIYTYMYNVNEDPVARLDFVFKAGNSYSYTDGNEIRLLASDRIYVSEHFDYKTAKDFNLSFEAYIRQVIA